MYVIYSMYMTYRVTKIKMQNMVMQKLFSNNCCSIVSAQLCLFLSVLLEVLRRKRQFLNKIWMSPCHLIREYLPVTVRSMLCVSHLLFSAESSLSAATRYLQLSPETIQTNVLNGEKPAESPSVSMATEIRMQQTLYPTRPSTDLIIYLFISCEVALAN